MKCRWLGLCVVIVLLAVPAQAEKPFDESSLLGTYAFTEIHVRANGWRARRTAAATGR